MTMPGGAFGMLRLRYRTWRLRALCRVLRRLHKGKDIQMNVESMKKVDAAHRALEESMDLYGLSNSDLVELGKSLIIRGEAANRKMTGWRSLDFNGEPKEEGPEND
jgi:hypothetical protein